MQPYYVSVFSSYDILFIKFQQFENLIVIWIYQRNQIQKLTEVHSSNTHQHSSGWHDI